MDEFATLQMSVQQVINFILAYTQFVLWVSGIIFFGVMEMILAIFVGRRLRDLNGLSGD